MKQKLEVISKSTAEKLEAHAKVIHTLIAAQRRGAAEQFGYAFLAGRALVQAKAIVPNGNIKTPNAGFKRWVEVNFPEITLRTAENWMAFAESIMAHAQLALLNSPMQLGSVDLNEQSHETILQLVPEVMDGKGMMRFMRECRLLRAPGPQSEPVHELDLPTVKNGEKSTPARRLWERIMTDLEKGEKILSNIESTEDLRRYLEAVVNVSGKIRSALKQSSKKT
jgi:hypothetical protein